MELSAQQRIEQTLQLIETTTVASKLFGVADPKTAYRQFAQLIHPDHVEPKLNIRAQQAFAKLSKLYAEINGKSIQPMAKVIGNWIVSDPFAKGDLCDLYNAQNVKDEKQKAIFKLARSPKDTDLLEEEYVSLGILNNSKEIGADNFKKYIPKALERMEVSGKRANIISFASETHSLADLMELFPTGFDFRHCVWMLNRALSALGFIHLTGIVHGAITPEHLLYGPVTHSLTIVDWCCSTTLESNKHMPLVFSKWKDVYPPEINRKMATYTSIDLYMLFASMKLTKCRIPKRFNSLFDWVLVASPGSRPSDAFKVQERLISLADEEYGPVKYLKLDIPTN